MNPTIGRVLVVVPAHNEARRIGRCLRALKVAAQCVAVPVDMLVVCDACRDDTAQLCAAAGVPSMRIEAGRVGVARKLGIANLLGDTTNPQSIWLANTDADSVVPATWLRDQIGLAETGMDAVAGTVSLEGHHRPRLLRRFELQYLLRVGVDGEHRHVHGANLGVRASAYLDVGGFAPVSNHEDVGLVEALENRCFRIARPSWLTVKTSGRLIGRCDEGFSAFMSRIDLSDSRASGSLAPA
jgi:glycosyltransferase involved in cell wall biosynthesis